MGSCSIKCLLYEIERLHLSLLRVVDKHWLVINAQVGSRICTDLSMANEVNMIINYEIHPPAGIHPFPCAVI